jgi:hypothetical protein
MTLLQFFSILVLLIYLPQANAEIQKDPDLSVCSQSYSDDFSPPSSGTSAHLNPQTIILYNFKSYYSTILVVGNAPFYQPLNFFVDTGSSDIWFNDDGYSENIPWCRVPESNFWKCYDTGSRSTYKLLNDYFNIKYLDGEGARGLYISDGLSFVSDGVTSSPFPMF